MSRFIAFLVLFQVAAHAQTELSAAKPHRGSVIRYVTLPGFIKPLQQATLYAKTPGYLK
ncbi:MAG: hypothetical protein JWO89_1523, partial [Verrucomicrobiaceae bacterium]|nr:hypothetical protein [Verrucomicrobiaceae bacterium]